MMCLFLWGIVFLLPTQFFGSAVYYASESTAHWNADPDNRPLAQAAVGPRRVVGTVSKPSHVKINGAYVPVDADLRFEGFVDTLVTRNVQIEATDVTGNITTQDYWFEEPQNTGGIVYQSDARGNLAEVLTTEDTTTYQWDALDRLIAAERLSNDGTSGLRKSYHFDPASRLSRIESETWDGSAWQSAGTENYVFAGLERIQKRAANGTTVIRNYYADGFTEGGINYLYGRDRLGSIVELIDTASGAVVSRRDFSPFGIVRNESGSVQADFAYTGHFYDPELALHHSPTRVYDAGLGRWLSADIFPDAELLPEGTNLYAYVGNDPINFTDPLGLCRSSSNRNQANRPPPKQSGNSGSSGGNPPKKTASSASPQDGGGGSNASVRSSYKESFAKWQKYADTMQARGSSIEHIAKRVSNARLAARSRYQKMTPLTTRLSIYARNLTPKWVPARFPIGGKWFKPGGYGNPVGSSWKSLRSQGKSWNEILKSSLRANKN